MKINIKTFTTILLILVAMAGQAQTFTPIVEDSINFVITGTTNAKVDSVTWFQCAPYPQGVSKDYYAPVKDGQFRIEARLPRHTFIQIGDYEDHDLHFIVEETPTHINLVTGEVMGSDVQSRFVQIQMREREIEQQLWDGLTEDEQMNVMQMISGEVPTKTAEDSMHVRRYNEVWSKIDSLRFHCYSQNLDNCLPAYYLFVNHMNMKLKELAVFMHEDAPYAHLPAMSHVWKQYWGLQTKSNLSNKNFTDFEAETTDGQLHHLAEYAGRGQLVLLDFWASWCGPCIASFPLMKQMHEVFGERGLRIIGVSVDQDKDSWLNTVDKYQLPWLQLRETLASQSNRTSASEKYGITGVPTLVLIAPDGIVISTDLDRKELKTKLEEIFEVK